MTYAWPRRLLAAILCAGVLWSSARADEPVETSPIPGAATIYTRMALAMRRESPAAALSYRETFAPNGLTVSIASGKAEAVRPRLIFSPHAAPAVLDVTQRPDGVSNVFDRTTGARFTGSSLFWAPTWWSVHTSSVVAQEAGSAAAPADGGVFDRGRSAVLADALAISDRYYRVDVGAAGDDPTSYHLRLAARSDAAAHPLTDLYVDRQTYLLRAAVAAFENEAVVSGFGGTMRLDFGRVQSYWIVTGGSISASAHVFFRRARGSTAFTISDVVVQSPDGPVSR